MDPPETEDEAVESLPEVADEAEADEVVHEAEEAPDIDDKRTAYSWGRKPILIKGARVGFWWVFSGFFFVTHPHLNFSRWVFDGFIVGISWVFRGF